MSRTRGHLVVADSQDGAAGLAVAIVGSGVGRVHAEAYRRLPGVRLVGICDVDPGRADAAGEAFGIPAYYSVEDMLGDCAPDVVSIVTSEQAHFAPAMAALDSGAHVFCEKIMTDSLETGRLLTQAARSAPTRFGMNYNYRTIPRMRQLRDLVRSGSLGEISLVSIEVHALCWHHALDLVRYVFGPVDTVVASGSTHIAPFVQPSRMFEDFYYWPDPSVATVLAMSSGSTVSVSSSMYGLGDRLLRVCVFGTEQQVEITDMGIADVNGIVVHGELPELTPLSLDETFTLSIGEFVAAVVADDEPPATIDDGWEMLLLENTIRVAAKEGRSVPVARISDGEGI